MIVMAKAYISLDKEALGSSALRSSGLIQRSDPAGRDLEVFHIVEGDTA